MQEHVKLRRLLWPFEENTICHMGLCRPSEDWMESEVQIQRERKIKVGQPLGVGHGAQVCHRSEGESQKFKIQRAMGRKYHLKETPCASMRQP